MSVFSYRKETIKNLAWYVSGPKSPMRMVYNLILNGMSNAFLFARNLRDTIDKIFYHGKVAHAVLNAKPILWPNVPMEKRKEYSNGIAIVANLADARGDFFRVQAKRKFIEKYGNQVFVIPYENVSDAISSIQFCHTLIFDCVQQANSTNQLETEADRLEIKKFFGLEDSQLENFQCQYTKTNHKKTILYVNCYYGLNSFGGATVVAEGVAESITSRYPKDYNVCVFTIHPDNDIAPGTLRSYCWNNVMVYSCSANLDFTMEIENEAVSRSFEFVLSQIHPDAVHFHAVQGFGYGLAVICKKMAVPYVATLHDLWALCPTLFMSDDQKKKCGENGLSSSECQKRCGFQLEFIEERRKKLKDYLLWAKKVYVPSQYVAKIQGSYFPNISFSTNKNGIFMSKERKSIERHNHLRFLFVAGGEAVKGYFFLIDALKEFANLDWELMLIAPGGVEGKSYAAIEQHVTVLPHQGRYEMQLIYPSCHVLLFPSLVNESFGLTVREAIANNCFVVTSRCGGPTEAIVDGENGRLFDIGDKLEFKRILQEIFENKEKYINYKTTVFGDVRSFDIQADELLVDYDAIINEEKE